MALAISTNFAINANTALNAMNKSQSLMGKSISRISTGNRAANPADDPLSYFSGNKIKGDTDGYQALYNGIQDGAARLNVADSALSSIIDVLTEMKSKAIAYESLSNADKASDKAGGAISNAYDKLYSSLDSFISAKYKSDEVWDTTGAGLEFVTGLGGSSGSTTVTATAKVAATVSSTYSEYSYDSNDKGSANMDLATFSSDGILESFNDGTNDYVVELDDEGTTYNVYKDSKDANNFLGTVSPTDNNNGTIDWEFSSTSSKGTSVGEFTDLDTVANGKTIRATAGESSFAFKTIDSSEESNDSKLTALSLEAENSSATDPKLESDGSSVTKGTVTYDSTKYNIIKGKLYEEDDTTGTGTSVGTATYADSTLTITVTTESEGGEGGGEATTLTVDNMDSPESTVSGLSSISAGSDAIQTAINTLSQKRTSLGGSLSAMDAISSYLSSMTTANEAAYTAVTEANIAKEMTSYVKNNVYSQAAQAMISQANQSLAQVLNLLQ